MNQSRALLIVVEATKEWLIQHQLEDQVPLLPVLSEIFPFQWEETTATTKLSAPERYEVLKDLVTSIFRKWGEGKFSGLVIENLQWMHEESWSLLKKVVAQSNLAFLTLTMRPSAPLPSHLVDLQQTSTYVDFVVECM